MAAHQRSLGRYWLREQPAGTWIDTIPPWNDAVCDPDVDRCLMHQCMAGCVDDWGIPVKKRTEWTANHQALLVYLKKFQCDGSHAHSTPTGKALEKLKHYPVGVCNAVVKGIIELKKDVAYEQLFGGCAWQRHELHRAAAAGSIPHYGNRDRSR